MAYKPLIISAVKIQTAEVGPGGRFRRVMEHEAGMPFEPGPHLGVLVAAVIVEDDVDELAGRDLCLDRVEEANELLMPVALHAAADDLAFEHVESGKQCGRAVALVVMGHVPQRPGFSGSPGWVRSSAWICDFSSTLSTMACAGGST